MKVYTAVLLLIIILCAENCGSAPQQIPVILCMGDSITAAEYPDILQDELKKSGISAKVINLGIDGYTSGKYLEYIESSKILQKHKPDFILLQLGTNDIRIDECHTSTEQFAQNMGTIIVKLIGCRNAAGKPARVILATIPPIHYRNPFLPDESRQRVFKEINPAIRELAEKFNVPVQDNYQLFIEHPNWMVGVHPNREGYRQMAFTWLKTLSPFLQIPEKRPKKAMIQHKDIDEMLEGRVVFQSNRDGNFEIYVMDANGDNVERLTNHPGDDEYPVWSPDGSKIAFKSDRDGDYEVYVMDKDGKNIVQVTDNKITDENARWAPDGKHLVFHSQREQGWEIYTINIDGTELTQITNTSGKNHHPAWSPLGDLIAFTGNRYLGWGVYSVRVDGTQIKNLAAGGGACRPVWSRNGAKIAFVCAKKDDKGDIWIMNPDGSDQRCVTTARSDTYDYFPTWSRDNSLIIFASAVKKKSNTWELWVVTRDGKQYKQLTNNDYIDSYPSWY